MSARGACPQCGNAWGECEGHTLAQYSTWIPALGQTDNAALHPNGNGPTMVEGTSPRDAAESCVLQNAVALEALGAASVHVGTYNLATETVTVVIVLAKAWLDE